MIKKFLRPSFVLGSLAMIGLGYLMSVLPEYVRTRPTGELRQIEDIPRWMADKACVAPTDEDRQQDELALQVFTRFNNANGGGMSNAAFQYFGQSKQRRDGKEMLRICPNDAALDGIAKLTSKTAYWRVGGFPGDHDVRHLRIARNVGPRLPEILAIVSETAFANRHIGTEALEPPRDIKPLARVILAEFGAAAMPWSDQAFAAMGSDNDLQTTAAQIAVATRHPGALEKTAALMDGLLRQYPTDPVPDHAWMRFYELAFALARAGPEARPFIDPVVQMTCRTIQVWAPPFGWLSLPPNEMNRVLRIVGAEPCEAKPSTTDGRATP